MKTLLRDLLGADGAELLRSASCQRPSLKFLSSARVLRAAAQTADAAVRVMTLRLLPPLSQLFAALQADCMLMVDTVTYPNCKKQVHTVQKLNSGLTQSSQQPDDEDERVRGPLKRRELLQVVLVTVSQVGPALICNPADVTGRRAAPSVSRPPPFMFKLGVTDKTLGQSEAYFDPADELRQIMHNVCKSSNLPRSVCVCVGGGGNRCIMND